MLVHGFAINVPIATVQILVADKDSFFEKLTDRVAITPVLILQNIYRFDTSIIKSKALLSKIAYFMAWTKANRSSSYMKQLL